MTITIPDPTVALITSTEFLIGAYVVVGLIAAVICCRIVYTTKPKVGDPPVIGTMLMFTFVWPLILFMYVIAQVDYVITAIVLYKRK